MKIKPFVVSTGLVIATIAAAKAVADVVVLETNSLKLTIAADGTLVSLTSKPSGTEYAWTADPGPVAAVTCAGKSFPVSQVTLEGDKLLARFDKANVTATYEVVKRAGYLVLRLQSLEGRSVDSIVLLQLRVKRLPYLGSWIDVAWDDDFGICLCAGDIKTQCRMSRGKDYATMTTSAHKDVALEGTSAVLFGCNDPKDKFLDVMEVVERDLGMPSGTKNRRSPIQKYSYFWISPTPDNIDELIAWAKRGGFRMVLFSYNSFTQGAGHLQWNARYPGGMADLKKVTDAIRAAGLKVGLHLHYNKAHKSDPYVTPVPDDRLHTVRTFRLAGPVDEKADTITVSENPHGCTLDKGRRILKAGKELIAYKAYTTKPPFRFTGCQRGHLKTTATAHQAGDEAKLLDVDTWPIFIRYDQDTDIQDETARRIAEIFEQTGPYDMIYFDGAEDIHAPHWYHYAGAQHRVFKHFHPEPAVAEAAANGHFSWHMISRSNAYDSVAPDGMKEFCRKAPCRAAPGRALNFSRVNFGWLHGFGRSARSYIGPDVLEYVLSRGAAWDCPFSMTISLAQLKNNPCTEDCFDVIKTWEDARIENKISDAQREQLKNLEQEHHLFVNEQGKHELVAIEEIPNVAGGVFKAYSFRRASHPEDTCVLIWAATDKTDLLLPVGAGKLTAMRPLGKRLSVKAQDGKAVIPIDRRTYLVLAGTGPDRAREILRKAAAAKTAQ